MRTGGTHFWLALAAIALALPLPLARAQRRLEPPPPPVADVTKTADVAGSVQRAYDAGDLAVVRAVGALPDLDHWLAIEFLRVWNRPEVGRALADAAGTPERAALVAYATRDVDADALRAANEVLRRAYQAGAAGEAARVLEILGESGPPPGEGVTAVRMLEHRAHTLRSVRKVSAAERAAAAVATLAEEIGWWRAAIRAHRSAMHGAASAGGFERALEYAGRCLDLARRLGDEIEEAKAQRWLARWHIARSEWPDGIQHTEAALAIARRLGIPLLGAGALFDLARVHEERAEYDAALDCYGCALRIFEEQGRKDDAFVTLQSVANVLVHQGRYDQALGFYEAVLAHAVEVEDPWAQVRAYGCIGNHLLRSGKQAAALRHYDRAIAIHMEQGQPDGIAWLLQGRGNAYLSLGDYPRAIAEYERSIEITGRVSGGNSSPLEYMNLGLVQTAAGLEEQALANLEHARALAVEQEKPHLIVESLTALARLHGTRGDFERATAHLDRARELAERGSDAVSGVKLTRLMAGVRREQGRLEEAETLLEHALAQAVEMGLGTLEVECLEESVRFARAEGDQRRILRQARKAVSRARAFVAGLGEQEAATGRQNTAWLHEAGATAAIALGEADEAVRFLESGRASALLEGLRVRESVTERHLPADLRIEERQARATEARAVADLRRAHASGRLREIRSARGRVDTARAKREDVLLRIQRAAKAVADLTYPRPDSLEALRSRLETDEALILYGVFEKEAAAVVIRPDEVRLARLPPTDEIEALRKSIRADAEAADMGARLEALREAVVAPLGPLEGVRRVLVSPDGGLAYVPFPALFSDHEVVLEPSGTVYGVLQEERIPRGEGVLALGDPAYDLHRDERLVAMHRGTLDLGRLPHTADEARAIGTVTLLESDACEAALARTLATRERWRAVHLACHGLVDTERPMLSSLALTPDAENDGFLTVLDVFRMDIPADLVVLSACETGRGKVFRGEGILGLTRAFMSSGAPRVVVSLWKVDDEATQALMRRFYELWNPRPEGADPERATRVEGSQRNGLPAATALREAQAFVRTHPEHPEWEHPFYWAAWTLWGLPN